LSKQARIGVDVGGTFTDFVLVDEERKTIFTGKRLTTPGDPSIAILEGSKQLLADAKAPVADVRAIVHGTTLVTNTIIERKGAKVGLITTKGFRDVVEMGREIRYDLYDLFLTWPEPIAPRSLRIGVDERMDAAGNVLRPLKLDEVRDAAKALVAKNVEAIAVCFLHSYCNGTHEQAAKALLEAEFPGVAVTIASEAAPEIREFERTNTACANAYVQPLMQSYLARLETKLADLGFAGSLYIMLSGGGIATLRTARAFPIQMIESGPAAGAIAASYYSALTEAPDLISFDMGGTTAKMCVLENGRPERAHEFETGRVRRFRKGSGLPLKVPVIDLIEIGAGGGSIAWIDPMGLLKVGPESAGAEPGPVCYGRGGTHATVTDADLLLGYLSPDYFLGGTMKLDLAPVEHAIRREIAEPLGLDVTQAAAGIHSIVNENMAAATRMYIAEKGRDPRRYSLMAFGGAGPVHAYGLAKLLKLRRVICPLGAGVMSALGFLVAAPAITAVRSYVSRLDDLDWAHLDGLYAAMEQEARGLLVEAGATPDEIEMQRVGEMRYVGQGFEISVPLPNGRLGPSLLDDFKKRFAETYYQLFEREITGVPIEAMTWRLSASAAVPKVELDFAGQRADTGPLLKGSRRVYFPETGYVPCPVYNRYALRPGAAFDGPAIVEERESTVVVGPDGRVSIDRNLTLIIDLPGPRDDGSGAAQ
jgi:N-methylhydantoinase A